MSDKKMNSTRAEEKPIIRFFIQTGFGTAFVYLTSGVFLTGLAVLMGALSRA